MANDNFKETDFVFNMSLETLMRMNRCLMGMNYYGTTNDLNSWRSYCDTLYRELYPFLNDLKDYKEKNEKLQNHIKTLRHISNIFNNLKANDDTNPFITNKFVDALQDYDATLRLCMKELGFLMKKEENKFSRMLKEYLGDEEDEESEVSEET